MIKLLLIKTIFLRGFSRSACIVASLLVLISCSGGVSGTGDGGPIIVVDTDNSDGSETAGNSPDATDATDATTGDNSVAAPIFDHQVFPDQLMNSVSSALVEGTTLSERFSSLTEPPVTQKLSRQLDEARLQAAKIQLDLASIEEHLLDTLVQCVGPGPCDLVPQTITTVLTANTRDFNTALQPDTAASVGDEKIYSNLVYLPEITGYFDQRLQFTNQEGTDVLLRWTTDQQLISLYVGSDSADLHLLTNLQQTTTTLRSKEKATSTVLHAVVQGTAGTGNTVEADLHSDQQFYIRAAANADSSTLYAINPIDQTAARTREVFDSRSSQYAIATCSTSNTVCDEWLASSSNNATGSTRLATDTTLGDFTNTITSDLRITTAQNINEFVLAAEYFADQPVIESLVCGGQLVLGTQRVFCWQPLPLSSSPILLEELSTSGGYRLP